MKDSSSWTNWTDCGIGVGGCYRTPVVLSRTGYVVSCHRRDRRPVKRLSLSNELLQTRHGVSIRLLRVRNKIT